MTGLNDNHKRHILASLQHMDRLLEDILQVVSSSSQPLIPRYVPDLTEWEKRWVESYTLKIREQSARALELLQLAPPPVRTTASWMLHTHLVSIDIALEELYPQQMTGYGEISPEAGRTLAWSVEEIRRFVTQLDALLREASDAAQRPPGDSPHLAEPARELEKLSEIIARHQLVEFRPALKNLRQKIESQRYEIAVFGRVSSGKSSLINRLLEFDLLPVGATPITAVPIHIVSADRPELRVVAAEGRVHCLPVERLNEYATEQWNPGNKKRVVSLEVAASSPGLASGMAFVDTPGIASIATSGAQLAYAYLPSCDLGLVLVDASSSLEREDLALLRALHSSGISFMILLGKCDLLQNSDAERVLDYTRSAVSNELGYAPPVVAASSAESWKDRMGAWYESAIAPLVQKSNAALAAAHSKKIQSLRSALRAALELRSIGAVPQVLHATATEIEALLRPLDERLRAFRLHWGETFGNIRFWKEEWLESAARNLASGIGGGNTESRRRILGETLNSILTQRYGEFLEDHRRLAADITRVFDGLRQRLLPANEPDPIEFYMPSTCPAADLGKLAEIRIDEPGLFSRISAGMRHRYLRKELDERAGHWVEETLDELRPRLGHWWESTVSHLEEAYHAYTDPLRFGIPGKRRPGGAADYDCDLERDIQSLKDREASEVTRSEIERTSGRTGDGR